MTKKEYIYDEILASLPTPARMESAMLKSNCNDIKPNGDGAMIWPIELAAYPDGNGVHSQAGKVDTVI